MRFNIFFPALLLLVFLPLYAFAFDCNNNGDTIFFINGIFGDEEQAKNDVKQLNYEYKNRTASDTKFYLAYNPTHLSGLGDLIKAVKQAYEGGYVDYDLTNILRQMHGDLKTRKILLVGHSQGTFYTNGAYDYLIENGVPKESIAVYNVGTPAEKVAGGGNYLTSKTDKLISSVVWELIKIGYARTPLPPNISIELDESEAQKPFGGHSFSGVYLKSAPERIIGDMKSALSGLSGSASNTGCFTAPKVTIYHRLSGLGLAAGDAVFGAAAKTASVTKNASIAVAKSVYNTFSATGALASQIATKFGKNIFIASLPVDQNKNPEASANAGNSTEEVFAAPAKSKVAVSAPPKNSTQDDIDDILERIDLLRQQLADLAEAEQKLPEKIDKLDKKPKITKTVALINYPKILISEVHIESANDSKQEFVELHNLHDVEINLSDWYLQRKTGAGSSYSTFVPNTLFSGKRIAAHGYFLIARQDSGFASQADIVIDNPLTQSNTLVLKNPNGDISDKVGWGRAQDFELLPAINPEPSKSIGRKIVLDQPQDTNINDADFVVNIPTPKSQNIAYIKPADEVIIARDTKAPEVIFSLSAKQPGTHFAINFAISDPLQVVSPSGIDSYIFRWKEGASDWTFDSERKASEKPLFMNVTRDFTGKDETHYYFQVKTKDFEGNESDWQPELPAETKVSLPKTILINEIQIDGKEGPGGTEDDWVELHNPYNFKVDLSEWSIQKHGSDEICSIKKSFFKKNFTNGSKIAANGFFLIANTGASENLKSMADMTTSWSLSDNNTVYLSRSQEEIVDGNDVNISDKVGFGAKACFAEKSPASTPPEAKSITRKKVGQDTNDNSQDFKISNEVTPKGTFPKSTIKDATDYSLRPSSDVPGAPVYSFLIAWSSLGAREYEVQYKLGDSDWKPWLSNTAKTSEYFKGTYSLLADNVYQFRVRGQDGDGNVGDWAQLEIGAQNPVVISEIAYAGTDASAQDQWIELYNKSDEDIDITGWKIISSTNGVDTLNLSLKGTILAKGYFVIERNDDYALTDVLADQLFLENQSIGKHKLYLQNKNKRYVDEFFISNAGLGDHNFVRRQPAPDAGEGEAQEHHYSIERISPYSFGSHFENWRLNNGKTVTGKDRDGNPVYGTPGSQNSLHQLYTYYESSFIDDTILRKELSPFLFKGMNVHVNKNVTLTIEPGTVIKFNDTSTKLEVHGTLKAIGTESEKIVFTALRDDEYGGDSSKDSTLPEPGSWLSLYFTKESVNSELEHVIVRYAGGVLGSVGWGSSILVEQSKISLKNSLLEKNENRVLHLINSNSVIDDVVFLDNNLTDWPSNLNQSKAIWVRGGRPEIRNSHFENNSFAIYINSFLDETSKTEFPAEPIIENNVFIKNNTPIYVGELSYPSISGSEAEENIYNVIELPNTMPKDIILGADLPYLIKGVGVVPENITLTLRPGVTLQFYGNHSGLEINGTLKAAGESGLPIIFQPLHHDDPEILPGRWLGLRFTKTSKDSELENINISHAGSLMNQNFGAGIKIEQAAISLKDSIIQKSANNGVWLINSPSVVDEIQFTEINYLGEGKAARVEGGTPEIKNSHFVNNKYGIYISDWNNAETGETILGEPVLENNEFEENVVDIFP